jgi:uncharacterized protein (DUF2225 family)
LKKAGGEGVISLKPVENTKGNIKILDGLKEKVGSTTKTIKSFVSANAGLLGGIAAAAAIIAVAVIAYDSLNKAYNKDAIAAEKAAKNAKQLAEAY